jgi:YidC/Oxa1 family membrane protein insertase
MESQRSFLFIGLILVTFFLFQEWQKDYNPQIQAPQPAAQTQDTPAGDTPGTSDMPNSDISSPVKQAREATSRMITVTTNVLKLQIDTAGGNIVGGDLLAYLIEQGEPEPIHLLAKTHQAQSGLLGLKGANGKSSGKLTYMAKKLDYSVNGSENIVIPLTWTNNRGVTVTKTFTIKPDEYDIDVTYTVQNSAASEVTTVQQFAQLKKIILAPESTMMMNAYNAATYSTKEERYEKYDLDDMTEQTLDKRTEGGWVAMQQHYFVAAWLPPQTEINRIYSIVARDGSAIIGYKGAPFEIQPGTTQTLTSTLYAGPKIKDKMGQLSESLRLTVDYGPLFFISEMLFWLLNILQGIVTNWGVAIILITIIVKIFLYPLTKKQTVSMAKMRNLQPKMAALKERFGDDKQKMGPAMMELYKKEQVNPMGGCLPLLLQMPIFLALYWMLMESVELRHAEFILWITDLSTKDPYFVLPVLYGASMFLMQKLQPTPTTDPMQQKVMMWMPVVFSLLFIIFPAGLVLYWLVNNCISILQTLYIYKQIDKKGLDTPKPAKAK